MKLDRAYLDRAAAETGSQSEALEKVFQLIELLESLRGHPFLAERSACARG